MHKSGTTIALTAGEWQAEIVTVGAGLASLTRRQRHVVIPHPPEAMPLAHLGKVLMPWPNRIADGRFTFAGQTLTPAINDRVGNTAIHGLLAWHNWAIREQSPTHVVLSAFLPPTYGYPFMLTADVTYQLDEDAGLRVRIAGTNAGDAPAPYGVGLHPYLTCNLHVIDACELTLPAAEMLEVDAARLRPARDGGLDFRAPRRIADTLIDHTFKALSPSHWEARLSHATMSVWLRAEAPWIQVYSGEKLGRVGLAIEPMSCPPNAFNSGIDLVRLTPGQTHTMNIEIGGE
ncbi:aldose-1-epimerase [Cronobacter turicensis]|uniref:aldose-1-epimerase n=1 Tax=Cronobacter turicensis TaxID=413502 RepID=UPI0024AEA0A4|nr:aldose-1-epimerase [Cronobacter turicensis]MDI7418734.1 aldose-1-epimerase [Cronobacter turicensis]MDI7495124.1 aldose-1-epimerase [Cronobacter turicensis]